MTNPKEVLNKIKWKQDYEFDKVEVWYLHRGAPQDTKIIAGKNIVKLEKSFIETDTAMIPYHRVLKIIYDGKTIFHR